MGRAFLPITGYAVSTRWSAVAKAAFPGLGYLSPRNLIDQHAGKIEFTSWPGRLSFGFTCRFGSRGVYAQRGIVWVVDDDSSIRWVLERARRGRVDPVPPLRMVMKYWLRWPVKRAGRLAVGYRMPGMDGAIKAD